MKESEVNWKQVEQDVALIEASKEAKRLAKESRIRAEAVRRNRIILSELIAQSTTPRRVYR